MVNHIRTLLLNVTADVAPDDVYISPAFRPIIVPGELVRLYDVVLSPNTRPEVRAQRVNTFMRLLHVADHEPFTLLPDERLTYDPTDQELFFDTTLDSSTTIDFEKLLNLVRSAVNELDAENKSLFRPITKYPEFPDLMTSLRNIWNNDLAGIGRLTAAILGLAYRFDDLNSG